MHCKGRKRLCAQEKIKKVRGYRDNLIMHAMTPYLDTDSLDSQSFKENLALLRSQN